VKMMKLWIGNIDPTASDEEIRAFLAKYTHLDVSTLTRVPGDGSRPAVLLDCPASSVTAIYEAQRRLEGMHWRSRTLVVSVL